MGRHSALAAHTLASTYSHKELQQKTPVRHLALGYRNWLEVCQGIEAWNKVIHSCGSTTVQEICCR